MYLPANLNEGRYIFSEWLPGCKEESHKMNSNQCSAAVQRTYTVEQVAEILGVSIRKAYYLCECTKEFKVIRLGRRCLRVHKESFDKWLDGVGGAS